MPLTGVVLLTMGEPEDLAGVRPFLRRLLADPDLVRLPVPALQPLFAWGVSLFGGARLRQVLRELGGGSPLNRLTETQRAALQQALPEGFRVYTALRYCEPSSQEAARRMLQDGVAKVVALPLYPQFCAASSGSSLKDLRARLDLPINEVRSWPDHPGYIAALCDLIARSAAPEAHLLFSAHGVPLSFLASGDPYEAEVRRTVASVLRVFPDRPHSLAYQSRTGRGRWLGPDTADEVQRLARAGTRSLAVVPLSFVSDHSETLHELDLELKRTARDCGVRTFVRVPALNDSPAFIAALRDLVLAAEGQA